MIKLKETKNSIIFENNYTKISLSKSTSLVEEIIDKKTNINIKKDNTSFFSIIDNDEQTAISPDMLTLNGDILTLDTIKGKIDIKLEVYDNYFVFELLTELPKNFFKLIIAQTSFNCEFKNKENLGIVTMPLCYWVDPVYYPDSKALATAGEIYPHLRNKNARLALICTPIVNQKDIIKEVCLSIDRNVGIMSKIGGAWGRDSRLNFGNYIIETKCSKEFIEENLEYYKKIGVDQIDFHQGYDTFRQGDFKFEHYNSPQEFKENVSDVLEKNGMSAGLHTYTQYIRFDCDAILSNPKWQKDLGTLESFTLSKDISENDKFLPTDESTEAVIEYTNFFLRTTPFVLIGNEIVKFKKSENGFEVVERGWAGTKAVAHKKGDTIKLLDGYYGHICPVLGSELFLQIARDTAKAFNEGGFSMIYLDALDGIRKHCETYEFWYYTAQFVCELLKYCDKYPLIEFADFLPSLYSARGRIGAWDTPYRAYKNWNNLHTKENADFIDRYSAPTLGWYCFYPTTDKYPGNEHTKYHHTDAIEHMGSLAVMYDFSNVFNTTNLSEYERYEAVRKNITIYKKYDNLRKMQYFNDDILSKLKSGKWEYHLKETSDGKWVFVEKDYKTAKLFNLNDDARNFADFENPFDEQVPFVRIEALMSTLSDNPTVMLPLDENKPLTEQKLNHHFDCEIDFSDKLAKKVTVKGNGVKGGAIAIKTRCASGSEYGYGEYIIDTDFLGTREFILLEADNGERPDLPFDNNEGKYAIYRSGLNNDRITSIAIETHGDMSGVYMSSIVAYEHTYEVLKNPTVTIGDMSVMFECELMSTDFIEFDGETAKVIDRYGNEKKVWFTSNLRVPKGNFKATLTGKALNRTIPRAQLTFGFTGKEIK